MLVSVKEALEMMRTSPDCQIVDVRTREEFDAGHIEDAINVPNETIGSKSLRELPDKNQVLILCCRSGNRSEEAADKLIHLGYTNVYDIGSLKNWPYNLVQDW
ncbi:MAG: rhodanese-like domain-containing protein [Clostridium sp.]|nr:rhodanese-like domain-containing protein [Clostridium sp.]